MKNEIIAVDTWREKDIKLYDNDIKNWKYFDLNGTQLQLSYIKYLNFSWIMNSVLVNHTIIRNSCKEFMRFKHLLTDFTKSFFIIEDTISVTIKGEYLYEENRKTSEEYHDENGCIQWRPVKNKRAGKYSKIWIKIIIPCIKVREPIISYMMQHNDLYHIFNNNTIWSESELNMIRNDMINELTNVFANIDGDGLTFKQHIDKWAERLLNETDCYFPTQQRRGKKNG